MNEPPSVLTGRWSAAPSAISLKAPPERELGIERHSIDFVPEHERHGRVGDQGLFWFLSNFQFFAIAIGFVGPSLGLSLGYTVLAGAVGIVVGTAFQAFHASQGAEMGLPQMIQSRAQFGYRGVIVPLLATLVSVVGYNVVSTVLASEGIACTLACGSKRRGCRCFAAGDHARDLGLRLVASGVQDPVLDQPAVVLVPEPCDPIRQGRWRCACERWLQLARICHAIGIGSQLQYWLRALRLGLFALLAESDTPRADHPERICGLGPIRHLVDRARRVARDACGHRRRAIGTAAGRRHCAARPWLDSGGRSRLPRSWRPSA